VLSVILTQIANQNLTNFVVSMASVSSVKMPMQLAADWNRLAWMVSVPANQQKIVKQSQLIIHHAILSVYIRAIVGVRMEQSVHLIILFGLTMLLDVKKGALLMLIVLFPLSYVIITPLEHANPALLENIHKLHLLISAFHVVQSAPPAQMELHVTHAILLIIRTVTHVC